MLQKISYAFSLGAWLATWVIGFVGLGWPVRSAGDAAAILLTAFPYWLIVGMVWWFRKTRWASLGMLILSILIAALGVIRFSSAWQHYHHEGRAVAEMSVVVTPILQLILLGIVFGAMLLWRRYQNKKGRVLSKDDEPETSEATE